MCPEIHQDNGGIIEGTVETLLGSSQREQCEILVIIFTLHLLGLQSNGEKCYIGMYLFSKGVLCIQCCAFLCFMS